MEPGLQLQFSNALSIPPLDLTCARDAGLNDLLRESFGDDRVGDAYDLRIECHLVLGTRLQPANGKRFGTHYTFTQTPGQRLHQQAVLCIRQTVSL